MKQLTKEERQNKKCSAVRVSGYWKGTPCGSVPMVEKDGQYYCKNHVPIEAEE